MAEKANGVVEQKPKQQPVMRPYPFHEINLKWQRHWEDIRLFRTTYEIDTSKPKYYLFDMFPYPRIAWLPTITDWHLACLTEMEHKRASDGSDVPPGFG
ncbi:leucine--tRNA ligase [Pyrus ussuriensis x Pyrus communis]|uniref:Leucine--tRNA ligase n=1 Tax=Pyrus ussuriensis x Pyrus communis TaxID=2448454 RepID=A0A5N5H1R5_9ROSA|nr:leucine--tRNA ligase [Pyrus ussuriensis x Pyrus communis]